MGLDTEIIVAMDTRVLPRTHGGLAQATMGLVGALGKLDGPERYLLVVESEEQSEWLKPYTGSNQRVVNRQGWNRQDGPVRRWARSRRLAKRLLRPATNVLRSVHRKLHSDSSRPELEMSDGFFESLGCDVLHYTWQRFVLAAVPTIYTPHDLQHLHYPQFFTAEELARREVVYPAGCHFAQKVIAGTKWIKDDIVERYGIHPGKVQVIPWAPPTLAYTEPTEGELIAVQRKYDLQRPFAFYPAAAWPHKNHIRLLEAVAHVRDSQGIELKLICTGSIADDFWLYHWPKIDKRLGELKLREQVKFLGFVPEGDMRAIYKLAQFLVMPSLFEADSCPIHEAWTEGLPVTSSNAAALPDQILDAALLFDPKSVTDIARAMAEMAGSPGVRESYIQRGYRRVRDFDWGRTAAAYRAVYRQVAGRALGDEDRWLLSWDWMKDPGKSRQV